MTATLTVPAYQRRRVHDAYAVWQRQLPRDAGQIGGTIVAIVEGPPFPARGRITAYSDFDDGNLITFTVDPRFRDWLEAQRISFN